MATKHVDIRGYCDSLYGELYKTKERLADFRHQIENMEGKDKAVLSSHVKQLNELIDTIEWKMEIFSKSCPVDWSKFGKKSEATASVPTTDSDMPAGGYAGG